MRNSAERAKARVVAWNVYNAMADVGNAPRMPDERSEDRQHADVGQGGDK